MNERDALRLLHGAIPQQGGVWADLGCGDGTFTLALAELLGRGGRIYAVDRDERALRRLGGRAVGHGNVIPVLADFTGPLSLPGQDVPLDGILLANALHYVRTPEEFLARLASMLRPDGRVVFVEYDRRAANPWVPYPISPARLERVTRAAGLSAPVVTATQPSAFTGNLYVAAATWPGKTRKSS
jgi:ubiquinone/menaquinone biosynthesis C-methylase UbiE